MNYTWTVIFILHDKLEPIARWKAWECFKAASVGAAHVDAGQPVADGWLFAYHCPWSLIDAALAEKGMVDVD